jgi:hypothetical protein
MDKPWLECESQYPMRTPLAGPDDDRATLLKANEKSSSRLRRMSAKMFSVL